MYAYKTPTCPNFFLKIFVWSLNHYQIIDRMNLTFGLEKKEKERKIKWGFHIKPLNLLYLKLSQNTQTSKMSQTFEVWRRCKCFSTMTMM